MSKRVYGLKRATPKMKYQHMKMVMDWKGDLAEKQQEFSETGNPIGSCGHELVSRPLFMVGTSDLCFACYEAHQGQATLAATWAAEQTKANQRASAEHVRALEDEADWLDHIQTQECARY